MRDAREQSGTDFVFAINGQRIKPKQKKVMKKFIALLALVLVSASTMMYAQESNAAARRAERKAQRDAERAKLRAEDVGLVERNDISVQCQVIVAEVRADCN